MGIESIHPEVLAMESVWSRVRDAFQGQAAIKAAGDTYLPRLPGHDGPDGAARYENYKNAALFLGVTSRTVRGLVGAAMWKKPQVDMPAGMAGFCRGMGGIIKEAVRELLISGRIGILIDRGTGGGDPYPVLYRAGQIINYHASAKGLERVVLREGRFKPSKSDPYEMRFARSYRELVLENGGYVQRVWEKGTSGFEVASETVCTKSGRALDHIPFVIANADGVSMETVNPPLIEVADVNIAHYQLDALHKSTLEKSALIQPYVSNWSPDPSMPPLPFGSGVLWDFATDATPGLLEPSGNAFEAYEREKSALETRMAALGARMLEAQKKAAETAEALRLRASAEQATLLSIVLSVQDALSLGAEYAAEWADVNPEKCMLSLNTDFSDTRASAGEMEAWTKQVQAGLMSFERYAYLCNQGEVWMPGLTAQKELQLIDGQRDRLLAGEA